MKVFITGGAGYIGTALTQRLNQLPEVEQVTVYDALTRNDFRFFINPAVTLPKTQFIRGDILDTDLLKKSMEGHDAVVHLAAYTDSPYHHKQTLHYDQTNAYGTLSVVRAAEATPSLRAAIYTSSAAVYGFRDNIDPAAAPAPDNGYGASKLRGEAYWQLLNHSISHSRILRLGHVFGAHRSMHFESVLHAFLFEALTGGTVSLYGDGSQSRAFIALNRVVQTLIQEMNPVDPQSDPVQFLADFQLSINDILTWLRERLPEIQYRYHSPNAPLPSQKFKGVPQASSAPLDGYLNAFRELFTLP